MENRNLVITDPCYVKNRENIEPILEHSTLYGDWSCFTYSGYKDKILRLNDEWWKLYSKYFREYNNPENGKEKKKELRDKFSQIKDTWMKDNKVIGRFCADSGEVGVYYLEDIQKHDPDFFNRMGDWCYTVVHNFSGTVELDITTTPSGYKELHVLGKSDITPFYTCQSGL